MNRLSFASKSPLKKTYPTVVGSGAGVQDTPDETVAKIQLPVAGLRYRIQ